MNSWLKIIDKKDGPVEMLIYDQIGRDWFGDSGVQAKDFAEELKKIPTDREIVVAINSPGGNVWDGLAIYHQMRARGDKLTTRVDGIAASIASVIALGGSWVSIPKNALMMIHDPSAMVAGNAADFREMADKLDMLADNLASIYAGKTGRSVESIREAMRKETFYDGTQAKEFGLVDNVTEDERIAATVTKHFRFDYRAVTSIKPATAGATNHQENTMRKEIIAKLKLLGVTVAEDATDEQLMALLNKHTAPVAQVTTTAPTATATTVPPGGTATNVVSLDEFNKVKASLDAERTKRITASLDQVVANNPSIDRAKWLPRVLANEDLIQDLIGLPGATPSPLALGVQNLGNPLVEGYKKMKPGAERNKFRMENHDALQGVAMAIHHGNPGVRFDPQNANTLAAALTPDYLADGLIINARNRLAPLAAFSRNFSVDPMKPKSTVQVARATAGATAQTDPTNWESGDTTLAAVAVSVSQKSVSFHLTNDQLNKGHQIANLAGINADQFADAISDVWTALLVVGTYGTPGAGTGVVGASTAFDPADIPQLFALAKNFRRRNLIMDGSYLGYLFPGVIASFSAGTGIENGGQSTYFGSIFGMDGIWMQNRYTGAVANSVGFLCGPDAIAVASGLPISTATPSGEFLSQQVVNIDGAGSNSPSIGLSAQVNMWYSRPTRTIWASYDVMFGAAAGDASTTLTLGQGRLLVSA